MDTLTTPHSSSVLPSRTSNLSFNRIALFCLFFLSGFCSLLYQVVWVRMAFAHFGIITPVLSVVLSVFMLGLGIGALGGGKLAERVTFRSSIAPAYIYAVAELIIGLGAFAVPVLFQLGEDWLLSVGASSSLLYLVLSAVFIVASILPWCIMMGATFPLMMAFMRALERDTEESFSFLYLANVIGAMAGTLITALVLVEAFGFRRTYMIAAVVNFMIAGSSFLLGRVNRYRVQSRLASVSESRATVPAERWQSDRWTELVLFTTGFVSLAMEVVWTRAFTFVLHTTIYAFASILATYLLATWVGSALYRLSLSRQRLPSTQRLLQLLCVFVFIPVVLNDPRLQAKWYLVLASIVPICGALGYLTPKLVDEYSRGNPERAGRCYSINILGGILGPLVAGYLLIPFMDVRAALIVLAVPFLLLAVLSLRGAATRLALESVLLAPAGVLLMVGLFASRSYEEGAFRNGPREVHRDHVASAVAYGTGMTKGLLVNGVGITNLTPITKVMAHLPLAEKGDAKAGLVICFGMGTTLRAMRSWGIDATAVDLTQSVIDSFGFFHADAAAVTADPNVHIVTDDGRRYLLRTDKLFDVITLDPPPPVEAAGSSLLYSRQFYEVVKRRLQPNGILAQWLPTAEPKILMSVVRSLEESFPYVVAFKSVEGWGYHFVASMAPIRRLSPSEFAQRLPDAAKRDLMEWYPGESLDTVAVKVVSGQTPLDRILPEPAVITAISDDRPYNEYYLLRRHGLMN